MAEMDLVDLLYMRRQLHIFQLHGETYESAKSFWKTLLSCNLKTPHFLCLRGRAYIEMEKRGWINLANLDDAADKLPAAERNIFRKLRSHATQYSDGRRVPVFQMLLKPYDVHSDIDVESALQRAVPSCVPYVVLKKNCNPVAKDVNDYSSREIDWLTRHSRIWMAWKVYQPDAGVDQQSDSEGEGTTRVTAPYTLYDSDKESRSAELLSPGLVRSKAGRNVDTTSSMSE